MSKPDPEPAATLHATASTDTTTNDWQEVKPTANAMGCTMGPVTVMTVPPVAGEFAGPSIEYEIEG